MDSTGLYDAFRSDVVDTAQPYLWSDAEVWRYMGEAQRMFVRLTGGVSDFTSPVTEIPVVVGEAWADLHPSVLRVMSMSRRSDGRQLRLLNGTDIGKPSSSDYGLTQITRLDNKTGPVHSAVLGLERNKVRWVQVPEAGDVVDAHVYRLPLTIVDGPDQELADVPEEHHWHLLNAMKALAYRKHDADTYDPGKARDSEQAFANYCLLVKAEWERYKHKTRVVGYGGL